MNHHMNMRTIAILGVGLLVPTALLHAQMEDIFSLEAFFIEILGRVAGLLVALAVMLFFWGLVKFIKNTDDTRSHEEGKKFIVWGLVSLFVIFSLWALVGLLLGELGITNEAVPYVNSRGG